MFFYSSVNQVSLSNKLFNVLSFVCLSVIYPLTLSCFDSLTHSHIHYSSLLTTFLLSILPFLPPNRHSFVHLLIHDKLISVACVSVPPSFPFFQYISHLFIHPSIYFTLTGGWFSGSPAALDLSYKHRGGVDRCWRLAGQRRSRIAVITFTWPLSACLTFCLSGSTTKV